MCLGGAGLPVDKLKLQGKIIALFPKHCECVCFRGAPRFDVRVESYPYAILKAALHRTHMLAYTESQAYQNEDVRVE